MRRVLGTVVATLGLVAVAVPCFAIAVVIGRGTPLGEAAFAQRMRMSPELRSYVAMRGYPDWAEEVEVDSGLPLGSHELRVYYLRLDREVSFARAFILGRPQVSLRLFERPIAPADRVRIEEAYLAKDPARRAELAAERAMVAAEHAERAADAVESLADKAEHFSAQVERDFHRRLRK